MPPSPPTNCSGMVTLREPADTRSFAEVLNSPPLAASQIETTTPSPMPIFGCGGLPYFLKRAWKLSRGSASTTATTLSSMSTKSNRVWVSVTSCFLISLTVGPAVGRAEQPAMTQASIPITATAFIAPRLWLREFEDNPSGPIAAAAFVTGECRTGRRRPVMGLARYAENPPRCIRRDAASLGRLQLGTPCRFASR